MITTTYVDLDRVVLTADKGVALVVMDKQEYISKAETLLAQPRDQKPAKSRHI